MSRLVPLTIASLFGLTLAACGASQQTLEAPDGTKVTITEDSANSRTVESEDGLIKGTGTKGAENARFPAFAPAYPGAEIQTSVDMELGPMKQHIITMLTQDSEDVVLTFYEAEATKAGLAVKRINNPSGNALMIGKTGLGGVPEAMVTTVTSAAGTSVNIAVTEK